MRLLVVCIGPAYLYVYDRFTVYVHVRSIDK